jgi:hypothetical protein
MGGVFTAARDSTGMTAPPKRMLTDDLALDAIAVILRDPDWAFGMLEDIAALVAGTGRDLAGDGTPTWDRH